MKRREFEVDGFVVAITTERIEVETGSSIYVPPTLSPPHDFENEPELWRLARQAVAEYLSYAGIEPTPR